MQATAEQINVKLFLKPSTTATGHDLMPVFHKWIQEDRLTTDLMIDVADYLHVPAGPGMMLICDRSHYSWDEQGGRPGFLYRSKHTVEGAALEKRIAETVRRAAWAASQVAADLPADKTFEADAGELHIFVQDRLRAPVTDESYAAFEQAVRKALAPALGDAALTIERKGGPRECLGLTVRATGGLGAAELAGKLA